MFSCKLYIIVIQFKSVTNRLFTVNIYRNFAFLIMSVPVNLQYYSMCSRYLPSICMFCVMHVSKWDIIVHPKASWTSLIWALYQVDKAKLLKTCHIQCYIVNGCINDVLLQCCDVAMYCADVMSNDVFGPQKRKLSSNKSVSLSF